MKKCKKCGAPLEGFLYNTIGKLMGIKPSASDPEICNKCESEKSEPAETTASAPTVETPVMPAEEKTAMPVEETKTEEVEEKKEDIIS